MLLLKQKTVTHIPGPCLACYTIVGSSISYHPRDFIISSGPWHQFSNVNYPTMTTHSATITGHFGSTTSYSNFRDMSRTPKHGKVLDSTHTLNTNVTVIYSFAWLHLIFDTVT